MSETSLRDSRIGIVGAGVMAEAMLAGLLDRGLVDADRVMCSHPREERRRELEERHGVHSVAGNAEAAAGADIVLLAVKPQMLVRVMPELRPVMRAEQLVISVIAGASTRAPSSAPKYASPSPIRSMRPSRRLRSTRI